MKVKTKPAVPTPTTKFEQCWYCELNADAGAEAILVLTKTDDDFQYFDSEPEEKEQIVTQVEIPRCIECKTAHNKVKFDDPLWLTLFVCFAMVALLGVYLGIFIKALPWWTYTIIALAVSGAVIGIAIAVSLNLLFLPKNIKELTDVKDQKEVQALLLKGWKVK